MASSLESHGDGESEVPVPRTSPTAIDDDGRSRRAQRRRQERHSAILDAAKVAFARYGYRETSVATVITAAGVSRGTFYSYFKSKDELFRALVEQLAAEMRAVVADVDPGHGERPVRQTFDNVRRVVDLLFSDRDLAIVLFRVAVGVDGHVDRIVNHLWESLYGQLQSALVRGVEYGHLRPVDGRIAAVAYVGSIKEVLYQCLVVETGDGKADADRERVAFTLFDLALNGVMAASP